MTTPDGWDVPFEASPQVPLPPEATFLAGGVVALSLTVQTPEGPMPGVGFRFTTPETTPECMKFYPLMVLVMDGNRLRAFVDMLRQNVEHAITVAEQGEG